MEIKITSYGLTTEIMGQKTITFEIEKENMISDLRKELLKRYPDFKKVSSIRFAINDEYCDDNQKIEEHDEILIIPPVSGG